MSAGDDSSVELNDPVEEIEFAPMQYIRREPLRSSGKSSNITEKHLKSRIDETIQDKTPPLRVVVAVQAAARMFLAKRRLREATRGPGKEESKVHWFYIKAGTITVKISVFRVTVRRTLKKNVTKTVTEKVRHHAGEAWERDRET